MKDSTRAELEKRFAAQLQSLADEALSEQPRELESRLGMLETYRKLLEQLPVPWYRRLRVPLAIAILSLVGAGLVWRLRKTPARVVLTAEISGVRMGLKAPLEDALPEGARATGLSFSVSGSEALRVDTGVPVEGGPASDALRLCQGQFVLDKLRVMPATVETGAGGGPPALPRVEVQLYQAGNPRWSLWNSTMTLDLGLWGPALLSRGRCGAGASATGIDVIDKQLPEPLELSITGGSVSPPEIAFSLDEHSEFVFRNLQVHGLELVREVPLGPGSHAFVSTVSSAELLLVDSGRTVKLSEGEGLRLRGFEGRVSELRVGSAMRLRAEGRAQGVWVGPEDFGQDLTPTYLEYLYNSRQLELLWGAAVFVWGVLWSAKRLLGG